MSERLEQFERESVCYEKRTQAPIEVIEEGGSPWRSFKRNPKVLWPGVAEVVEHAFDCGGFVAGGCGRWLRNNPTVSPSLRGAYVHEGGDIDLFFKDPESWRNFLAPYSENLNQTPDKPFVTLSKGKLAANLMFGRGKGLTHGYNSPPTVQAIRCVTGTPKEVILSFDFVNAMVAFDRDRVWVADGWERLERSKTLGVAWWGSCSVAFRVRKYMQKYGFKRIEDLSNGQMFEELVKVTNVMSSHRQLTSRDAWVYVAHNADIPLEMKLTLMASSFQGFDTNDVFSLIRRSQNMSNGAYERIYNELMGRHEAAKWRAEQVALNPPETEWEEDPFDKTLMRPAKRVTPETFDADMYCWAR